MALTCERAHDLLIDLFPSRIHNEKRIGSDNLDILSNDVQTIMEMAVILKKNPLDDLQRPIRSIRTHPPQRFV